MMEYNMQTPAMHDAASHDLFATTAMITLSCITRVRNATVIIKHLIAFEEWMNESVCSHRPIF